MVQCSTQNVQKQKSMEIDNELLSIYLLCSPCKEISSHGGGLMVSALDAGSSGLGTRRAHWLVLLCRTLNSHSASLHSGIEMDAGELNAERNPVMK